jgi:hypothetical protein
MYAKLPRGWVWAEATAAGALAHERVRDAYPIGHVLRASLDGRGLPPDVPRFAALQSATHHSSSGSYFVRLGATLTPGLAGELSIEVAVAAGERGLDPILADAVLVGALEGAMPYNFAGVLRFDRGIVHMVDCKTQRYRQAARTLTGLLAELGNLADSAHLAERCEALWAQPS